MDTQVIKTLHELIEKREAVALVTLTGKVGSGPRDSGSMMLVDAKGKLICGTIGGGGVEEKAKADAMACIEKGESSSFSYELTLKDTEKSLGMACGGMVDIFIKVFAPEKSLVVFGCGHIGEVLCKMGKLIGYHITVVDHRSEYANSQRFPDADEILTGELKTLLEQVKISEDSSVVIVTHGHVYDLEVLRTALKSSARYIGMIGSRNKVSYCFNELKKEGVSESELDRVYAPIGLDIGGDSPSEIALSILAEISAVRYLKEAPFLKNKGRC